MWFIYSIDSGATRITFLRTERDSGATRITFLRTERDSRATRITFWRTRNINDISYMKIELKLYDWFISFLFLDRINYYFYQLEIYMNRYLINIKLMLTCYSDSLHSIKFRFWDFCILFSYKGLSKIYFIKIRLIKTVVSFVLDIDNDKTYKNSVGKLQSFWVVILLATYNILISLVSFCRFRTINHKLPIEYGHWNNIQRKNRLCHFCNLQDHGGKFHYLLKCSFMADIIQNCINNNFCRNWWPAYINVIKSRYNLKQY